MVLSGAAPHGQRTGPAFRPARQISTAGRDPWFRGATSKSDSRLEQETAIGPFRFAFDWSGEPRVIRFSAAIAHRKPQTITLQVSRRLPHPGDTPGPTQRS